MNKAFADSPLHYLCKDEAAKAPRFHLASPFLRGRSICAVDACLRHSILGFPLRNATREWFSHFCPRCLTPTFRRTPFSSAATKCYSSPSNALPDFTLFQQILSSVQEDLNRIKGRRLFPIILFPLLRTFLFPGCPHQELQINGLL